MTERQVMPEEGEKLAASLGVYYVETSAKSNGDIQHRLLSCLLRRSISCEERGHGAKLKVGGSKKQGPTTDQVSGGRDPKQGKGDVSVLVAPGWAAMLPEAPGNFMIHKGLCQAQNRMMLGATEGHDPEVSKHLVSSVRW